MTRPSALDDAGLHASSCGQEHAEMPRLSVGAAPALVPACDRDGGPSGHGEGDGEPDPAVRQGGQTHPGRDTGTAAGGAGSAEQPTARMGSGTHI